MGEEKKGIQHNIIPNNGINPSSYMVLLSFLYHSKGLLIYTYRIYDRRYSCVHNVIEHASELIHTTKYKKPIDKCA